jgi:uncharacterized phage protein (TIGR01671 family)
MNRHILFRAKRKDNGEWVYGYYATQSNHACFQSELKYTSFILKDEFMDWGLGGLAEYEVIPESVGQFTGLTDKNGNKIFEGDIVKVTTGIEGYKSTYHSAIQEVKYNAESGIAVFLPFDNSDMVEVEVIGNIYDNPELLYNGD